MDYMTLVLLALPLVVVVLLGVENMLPTSPLTWTSSRYLNAFTDTTYLLVRANSLDPEASDGLDNRRQMWINAVRSAASFDNIKDWTASEQVALGVYLNTLFKWCLNYRAQDNIRRLAAQYCAKLGDDTKCIWTDTTWSLFEATMNKYPLPFVAEMATLVEMLNPVIKIADEVPERNIPPGFALMWLPQLTAAEMFAMRATLLAQVEGVNWMAKVQLPLVKTTLIEAFKNPPHIITPDKTNEFIFWYLEAPVVMSYDGGAVAWEALANNPMGDQEALTATVYWFLPGTFPWPLWSFKEYLTVYDATNSPLGCLIQARTMNNVPGLTYGLAASGKTQLDIIAISFASTSSTVSLIDDSAAAVEDDTINQATLFNLCADSALGGLAECSNTAFSVGFRNQTAGLNAWTYAAQNFITSMWTAKRGPVLHKQGKRPRPDRSSGGKIVAPQQKRSEEYKSTISYNGGVTQNGGRRRPQSVGDDRASETRRRRR
jgi:hypothetical protein